MSKPPNAKTFYTISHDDRRALFAKFKTDEYERLQQRRTVETTGYSYQPFDQHQCIFVHIPRTAGVSICQMLFGNLAGGHTKVSRYQLVFSKAEYDRYFKFTIVRNPWDRIFSAYHFLRAGGMNMFDQRWSERHLKSYGDFNDFVINGLGQSGIPSYIHFQPQFLFLWVPYSPSIGVDFVGYFETLQTDFAFVRQRLSLSEDAVLQHTNQSQSIRKQHYTEAYTPEMREIVGNLYRYDIDIFGYRFDGVQQSSPLHSHPDDRLARLGSVPVSWWDTLCVPPFGQGETANGLIRFGNTRVSVFWDTDYGRDLFQFFFGTAITGKPEDWTKPDYILKGDNQQIELQKGQNVQYSGSNPGDAAATLLDCVMYDLADRCRSGLMLRAAALSWQGAGVLFPGTSVSGKSVLSAWLVGQGFDYLTEELVFIAQDSTLLNGLRCPLLLKTPLVEPIEPLIAQYLQRQDYYDSKRGIFIPPDVLNPKSVPGPVDIRLIIFPKYQPQATCILQQLTPAQATLQLMSCLMNAHNLKAHSLPQTSRLSRHIPAYRLTYSDLVSLQSTLLTLLTDKDLLFVNGSKANE